MAGLKEAFARALLGRVVACHTRSLAHGSPEWYTPRLAPIPAAPIFDGSTAVPGRIERLARIGENARYFDPWEFGHLIPILNSNTPTEAFMLDQFIGQVVVVDLRSRYVCLGTLRSFDDQHFELRNADLHDLRDSDTTRENYVASSRATGIKRNRRRLVLMRSEVVAVALFEDVVDE
jgi:hypothetical protein